MFIPTYVDTFAQSELTFQKIIVDNYSKYPFEGRLTSDTYYTLVSEHNLSMEIHNAIKYLYANWPREAIENEFGGKWCPVSFIFFMDPIVLHYKV